SGVAGCGEDAGSGAGTGSEDDLRAAARTAGDELHGRAVADAAAEDPAVACPTRTAQGSDVPAGATAGRVRTERLHIDERSGDHHRRRTVRSSALSLRSAVLAMGDGDGVASPSRTSRSWPAFNGPWA